MVIYPNRFTIMVNENPFLCTSADDGSNEGTENGGTVFL
jgi:hypothetical protein